MDSQNFSKLALTQISPCSMHRVIVQVSPVL